jgi:diguanylate cyclase (GGDEF)-like protein/PAS domain S-box-containing protein
MARRGRHSATIKRGGARRRDPAVGRTVFHDLPADWYWEQDAELRFAKVEVRNGAPAEQALAARILGKKSWETGIDIEGGWDAHRAALEARQPFRDVLMWRTFEDGSRRYLSVTGEPVFDAKGRFTGYRGVGRDVTAQKRVERLLRLEHRVTRCLAEAQSAPAALGTALKAICETEGWDCAEFWKLDETAGAMRRYAEWSTPDIEAARSFADASRDMLFRPGVGLVGAAWQSGEPLWIADSLEDPRAIRKSLSEKTGLRAAVLFPIRTGGRVTVVLDFTCRRIRPPHKRLQQSLNVIATMIGQYLQRANAEQEVRESEARFRGLTDLSSDWYWEQDAEFRFTRLEGRVVAGGDEALRRRLIGTRRWDSGLEIDGGWEAHRALLDARKPFYDLQLWRTLADGTVRYLSVSGEPVLGVDGSFRGYRGVGRDVTAQKRAELLLRLEHHVARALAEAEDATSGLQAVIRAVCRAEGWTCGRYFRVDGATARFQDAWCVADPAVEQFVERSRKLVFQPGEGLTGAALQSGEPVWSEDTMQDPRVLHRSLWQGTGLRGGFAFPVATGNRIIGILNFSSPAVREPDKRLLQASRVIGSQIGQFLQRKLAEESLRESEARFRSLTQMSSDFFWETDAEHRLAEVVHGPDYPAAHMGLMVLGKTAWELASLSPDEAGWAAHRATLAQHLVFRDFEFARRLPDGPARYFSLSGEPRFAADGGFLGYRGVGRDITEIALARERISSLAYSDPLTGLANRTSLGPSLEQAVQRARRRNSKLALVFLDLDGFKQINDLQGHDAGDALLIELAGRLRANLRASDLVARLGGDEFLVVVEEVQEAAPIETVARKLLGEVVRPYALPGGEARVTASIGISVFPDDASDVPALMKHADTAMYAAKQAGKNTYRFYASGPAANDPAQDAALKADPGGRET